MVGWAPLPPGLDPWSYADFDLAIPVFSYSFVDARFFCERRLVNHLLIPARNVTLFQQTRNVTRYEVTGNRLVTGGVPVAEIERIRGRSVPRLTMRDTESTSLHDIGRVRGRELDVFRPSTASAASASTSSAAVPSVSVSGRSAPVPSASRTPAPIGTTGSLHKPESPATVDKRQENERKQLEAAEVQERKTHDAKGRDMLAARGVPDAGYFGWIFAILLPCSPRPAISPFWPKTNP